MRHFSVLHGAAGSEGSGKRKPEIIMTWKRR